MTVLHPLRNSDDDFDDEDSLFSMILIIKAFRPKTNNETTNKKKRW